MIIHMQTAAIGAEAEYTAASARRHGRSQYTPAAARQLDARIEALSQAVQRDTEDPDGVSRAGGGGEVIGCRFCRLDNGGAGFEDKIRRGCALILQLATEGGDGKEDAVEIEEFDGSSFFDHTASPGNLTLRILEARNLPKTRLLGTLMDPYV